MGKRVLSELGEVFILSAWSKYQGEVSVYLKIMCILKFYNVINSFLMYKIFSTDLVSRANLNFFVYGIIFKNMQFIKSLTMFNINIKDSKIY